MRPIDADALRNKLCAALEKAKNRLNRERLAYLEGITADSIEKDGSNSFQEMEE